MKRRQASLYLTSVPHIEAVRRSHNPEQARLIPPHVTLCREDEVLDWEVFRERLKAQGPVELTLEFGVPVREKDFVFLPVTSGVEKFHQLRRALLLDEPRNSTPHLTIIHPRNGTCTNEIFADILSRVSLFQYTFREVYVIEQVDGGVWSPIGLTESCVNEQ
jgi:2'-5' RNA ligase